MQSIQIGLRFDHRNQVMKDMCINCRRPREEHIEGTLRCPTSTYFTPCKHPNRQGMGAISFDGTGWSDSTCMVCGDRQVIGQPPHSITGTKS